MLSRLVSMFAVCTSALAAGEGDTLVVPQLTGRSMYQAHRSLRRLGLVSRFVQVQDDTAAADLFLVATQLPDSGALMSAGDTVTLSFNCPGMLRYWNASVLPLLGDFANTVSFYKVNQPPHPVKVAPAEYPLELRRYSFSGEATVDALVDFDGSVLAAHVTKSSGYEAADSSACESALRATFMPAEHYDQPARVWFPLPYHWRFEEAPELPAPGASSNPATQTEP